MKKLLASIICVLTLHVAFGHTDTVRVSVRSYVVHGVDYIAVFANGKPFMGDRKEFIKRLFPSNLTQSDDDHVVIYPYPTDTLYPYRIAVRNPIGFWEVAVWAPYKPRIEKFEALIVFSYRETMNVYRLVRMLHRANNGIVYARWNTPVTTDQSD